MSLRSSAVALLAASLLPLSLCAQAPASKSTLTVKVDHPTVKVSPTLYGLMTEEINYSYDGGLYAEAVRDRTIGTEWQPLFHWNAVTNGNSLAHLTIEDKDGVSESLKRSMKLIIKSASDKDTAGVQNNGWWGFPVRPQSTYNGSFFAKTDKPGLPITIALVQNDTGVAVASAKISSIGGEWKEYTYSFKTGNIQPSANYHLQLMTNQAATIWFNLVSLFPPTYNNRTHGFRPDLMEMMAAMHPTFLRMPGGNYLEGDTVKERFDWKKTIGPWTDRPTHNGPWKYRSSDGMGLLEFLQWCEDLKVEPVLAVYAGYSLQKEIVKAGPDLEPYVQDALDEIEYVTGATTTKWGAVRAQNGHPEPFKLRYVEIGNEDFLDHSGSYEGRYKQFHEAIKARYPQLQLIATRPVKKTTTDIVDDHFYMSTETSYERSTRYDKADRNGPKIFVGEWATREGAPTPNMNAALGDAAWMTGMERNSDLIIMSCYAPLFTNVNAGGLQWNTNLIGYDVLNSYGSPSYYAQVLFAANLGTEVVEATLDNVGPRVFTSVTRDEKNRKLYIKLVNGNSTALPLTISLQGIAKVGAEGKLTVLSAKSPNATNSLEQPKNVVPVESKIKLSGTNLQQTFAPYSINALALSY